MARARDPEKRTELLQRLAAAAAELQQVFQEVSRPHHVYLKWLECCCRKGWIQCFKSADYVHVHISNRGRPWHIVLPGYALCI